MEVARSKEILKEDNFGKNLNSIMEILAVQVSEFRKTDLIDCMNRLGNRDEENQQFSFKNIRPLLTALSKNGSILQNEKGVCCKDGLWLKTIESLVMADRYGIIASAVLISVPLFKPPLEKFYAFNGIKEFYRAVLIAVFTDEQVAGVDLVCQSGKRNKKFWNGKEAPLLTLFNQPFIPGLMDRIKLSLRWKILGHILDNAQKKMIPVPGIMAYGILLLSEYPGSDEEFRVLDHLFVTGHLGLHREFLAGFKETQTVHHLIQLGKSEMLCGNNDAARLFFKQALGIMEKESQEQKYSLKEEAFIFLLLSFLGSEDADDFYLGIRCIVIFSDSPEGKASSLQRLSKAMLPLFHAQVKKKVDPALFPEDLISMDDPLVSFFSILILSWCREDRVMPYVYLLERIREKTMACEYDWLTAEICTLLARLGKEADINAAKAANLHEALGTKTIVSLFKPVADWENALLSMIRMGEQTQTDTGPQDLILSEHRLVWQLKYNEETKDCHLTPRIQKRNKNGTWTKG